MSVAPDMLLTSLTVAKPQAAPAKTTPQSTQLRDQEASSFSQVYAKERQASPSKPAERNEAAPKNTRDSKASNTRTDEKPAAVGEKQPTVADDGKSLPADAKSVTDKSTPETADTQDATALVDPALLPVMLDMPPLGVDIAELGLPQAEPVDAGDLFAAVTINVTATEPALEGETDVLDLLPGLGMALEPEDQPGKVSLAPLNTAGSTVLATPAGSGQVFASAMAAMGANPEGEGVSAETDTLKLGDLPLEELSSEGLEALKESSADTAPEQFVSKLSVLSQAIGQQNSQVARIPLVPGQPVAMQQAGWSDGVVDKVMWMSSQNLKSAEIQLDPAELGRLDVRISLNQDQTQISFTSAHAGVREALESQVHRLREMFNQQGLNLADVNVSDQSQGRAWQGQQGEGGSRGGSLADGGVAAEDEVSVGSLEIREPLPGTGRGMVDYYA